MSVVVMPEACSRSGLRIQRQSIRALRTTSAACVRLPAFRSSSTACAMLAGAIRIIGLLSTARSAGHRSVFL